MGHTSRYFILYFPSCWLYVRRISREGGGRKEHVGLPNADDIVEAVTSAKIAATVGELVSIGNYELEYEMAKSRWQNGCHGNLNYSIIPRSVLAMTVNENERIKSCSMCGDYCGLEFAHSVIKSKQL